MSELETKTLRMIDMMDIRAPVLQHKFCSSRKWRFDFAWPEKRIALEIEGGIWVGGRHVSPGGFIRDIEKYNTASVMGWMLLRATEESLDSGQAMVFLETAFAWRDEYFKIP